MSTKKNQPATAFDSLANVINAATSAEFVSLSKMAGAVGRCLRDNPGTVRGLAAYGFSLSKKPDFDAFVAQLKDATFSRHANLECKVTKTERDQTTGKDVTFSVREMRPAIWYDDDHAAAVRKALRAGGYDLPDLIDPETGGRYEKKRTFRVYEQTEREVTYKDENGKTQKKTIKMQTGDPVEKVVLLHAYERKVWSRNHVLAGLREMLFDLDQKTTTAAKLAKEFEQMGKDNAGK